jgi:hypothetical protein
MALNQQIVTVPYNTPTLLAEEKTTVFVIAYSGVVKIGNASVTLDDGFDLPPNEVFRIELGRGEALYGTATGATPVHVLTQG